MEKEQINNLIVKLTKKLEFAKFQAGMQDKPKKETGVFIKASTKLNPKYISNRQYFQIAQFYTFLKENDELTESQIRKILKSKNKFKFLLELDSIIPDFIEELKLHGPMSIAIDYAKRKQVADIIK